MQQLAGRVPVAVEFSSYAAVGGKGASGSGVFFICSSWGEARQLINPLLHFQTKDPSTVAH